MRGRVLLVEDMHFSIFTPRPCDDLILVSLEHDDGRVSECGATDSSIRVVGHIGEMTKHDVVRDDIGQSIGVLRNAIRYAAD